MGKAQRDKGRRGQTAAEKLLLDRDYTCDPITAGVKREDIVATSPVGVTYSVEVKNCASITREHRKQAMEQAKKRKCYWMLMSKIEGTSSWLVQRQAMYPTVWHEKESLL